MKRKINKVNRINFYLVMFLAALSLVTVGFASWTITDDFSTTTSGMIIVDDVLKVNDYITCEGNVKKFGYFKNGFVNEIDGNYEVSNVGYIEATLTINIAKCKTKFADCNTLEIDLSLESTDLGIFNSVGNSSIAISITNVTDVNNPKTITLSSEPTSSGSLYLAIIDLKNYKTLPNEITLSVVYSFTSMDSKEKPYTEYFSKEIYPILLREGFNFVLSAKLTGKVVG